MKLLSFSCLFLLVSSFAYSQNARILAHYSFSENMDDEDWGMTEFNHLEMTTEGGYLEGIYGGDEESIVTASLNDFKVVDFSIGVDFKITEFPEYASGKNVISVSGSCRYVNLYVTQDGFLELQLNNGDVREKSAEKVELNTWQKVFFNFNQSTQKAELYQNGKKILEVNHRMDLSLCGNTTDISTTDYGNGNAFKGYLKDWFFVNKAVSASKAYSLLGMDFEDGKDDDKNDGGNGDDSDGSDTKKPEISWSKGATSLKQNFDLFASVSSCARLTEYQIYLNDKLLPYQNNISDLGNCKFSISRTIQLNSGENKVRLVVGNQFGSTSSTVILSYKKQVVVDDSPINQKIKKTRLDLDGKSHFQKNSSYSAYGVLMASRKRGGAYISWSDQANNNYVSVTNSQDQTTRTVPILSQGFTVYAITGDNDGFAVLAMKEMGEKKMKWMYISKYTNEGRKVFENKLIGDYNFDKEGNRSASDWATPRIGFSGNEYAVYFGISRKWDDGVVHQGDFFSLVDKNGKLIEERPSTIGGKYVNTKGWTWGTSHSFEQRLTFDGNYFHTLAKGDAYPRGISPKRVLANLNIPESELYGNIEKDAFPVDGAIGENFVPLGLGGLCPSDNGVVATFITNQGKNSYDVGFLKIGKDGKHAVKWLTNTAGADENSSYLVKYGENYLATWTELTLVNSNQENAKDKFMAAVIDENGNFVTKPFVLNAQFPRRNMLKEFKWGKYENSYNQFSSIVSEFISYPNGDIGWVNVTENNEIELVRIRAK
jgi:hypothetical protein